MVILLSYYKVIKFIYILILTDKEKSYQNQKFKVEFLNYKCFIYDKKVQNYLHILTMNFD